jgi:deoxycytidylate deaminase
MGSPIEQPSAEVRIGSQPAKSDASRVDAKELIRKQASHEFVFAVVGHVGSGTSEIANALKVGFTDPSMSGMSYRVHILKAREVIIEWANAQGLSISSVDDHSLRAVEILQDRGDDMRKIVTKSGSPDLPAVARRLIARIKTTRETEISTETTATGVLKIGEPQLVRNVYILDALRHPAEVQLLRRVYGDAFVLIGVVCEEEVRRKRISVKYEPAEESAIRAFMKRDSKAKEIHGQRVADTFHLSDFFVDNSAERFIGTRDPNPEWEISEKLSRLIKIVTHAEVVRPEVEETAMYHAYTAMMQSACLSRQVGAALVDGNGNLIATGTNEVPQAGGGVYGEPSKGPTGPERMKEALESRCALRSGERFCSNTREQKKIIAELLEELRQIAKLSADQEAELKGRFGDSRIGGLLEFSRAVHAEMDALLSAGRTGSSAVGSRLFVTTFPCHYCARHIVASGVDEVQYIEPYPKSQALHLHDDSITTNAFKWRPPSKGGTRVLFRLFSGVAPRLYRRAFLKDRELKDKDTGLYQIGQPEWGNPWYLSRISYLDIEEAFAKEDQ